MNLTGVVKTSIPQKYSIIDNMPMFRLECTAKQLLNSIELEPLKRVL